MDTCRHHPRRPGIALFGAALAEIDAINSAQWDAQAQWAASVPGAEVITVPDTTHYVQNQRPDAVVDAIRAAIARA